MTLFQDGMGNLKLNQDGIRMEGISEFLLPLYVNEIQSRRVSCSLFSPASSCLLINTLWCTRNKYHWLKRMWKALREKDVSKAADKFILIFHCWGSYDQFIINKGQRSSELRLYACLGLKNKIKWNKIKDGPFPLCVLLLSSSASLISRRPQTAYYQGLPSTRGG